MTNHQTHEALILIRKSLSHAESQNADKRHSNSLIDHNFDKEGLTAIKNCISLIFSASNNINNKMFTICEESVSKESLLNYIDRLVLLKETNFGGDKKLQNILDTVLINQIKNCKYHNTTENKFTYFFDHNCKKESIPYKTSLSIEQHNEEILNIVYSNSFKYFATVIKGNAAIAIYQVNKYMDYLLNQNHSNMLLDDLQKCSSIEICLIQTIYSPHDGLITSIQWSKNDKYLLTASKDKHIKLFDPFTGTCKLTLSGHDGQVSSAIFLENDKKVISSGLDYKISMWNLNTGGEKELSVSVPNVTISELLYSESVRLLIVISATTNSVLFYDIETKSEIDTLKIPMNDVIVSCAISKLDNGAFLLVNSSKATPVLNLFCFKNAKNENSKNPNTPSILNVRKYFGHRQERFNNKCNFGGEAENFLLCGSEDGKICVWSRNHSIPILAIKTHFSPVNAVIWAHSQLTDIIISCSEDHTIKILTNESVDKVSLVSKDRLIPSLYRKPSLEHKIINPDDNNLSLGRMTSPTNTVSLTRSVSNMLSRLGNIFGSSINEMYPRVDSEEEN